MEEELEPRPVIAGEEDAPYLAQAREAALNAAGDAIVAEEVPVEPDIDTVFVIWLFQPDAQPKRVSPEDVPGLITVESNLVWIDISQFDESDVRGVAQHLTLDSRTVESILAPWRRPRIALFEDRFHVVVTIPELDRSARQVQARQLDLVIGNNFLLSAHHQPLPFYSELLARAAHDPDLVRLDSAFMLYIVLDELVGYFDALEDAVRTDVEEAQVRALRESGAEFLEDMLGLKRYVFAFAQVIEQHGPVFSAFLRPDFPYVSNEEVQPHFRALEDGLVRLVDRLDTTRQEVNTTFDIYLSRQAHRTNDAMKVLTMVATVLFTATFIEGFFGPSFSGIPTHTVGGFVAMVLLIAAVATATMAVFRWRGWM